MDPPPAVITHEQYETSLQLHREAHFEIIWTIQCECHLLPGIYPQVSEQNSNYEHVNNITSAAMPVSG